MQDHNLFKPKSFEEGKHAVVGDCNGFTMQERWEKETPLFASAIRDQLKDDGHYGLVLDYGCGVGRLAKEVLREDNSKYNDFSVTGVDASSKMMKEAKKYVNNPLRFVTKRPEDLVNKYDLAYCVYVLQHVPAIEIREILARIHYHLKDDGVFIYCSSDYRMAIRYDGQGFFDDRFLGVNLQEEVQRYFKIESPLFSRETINENPILKTMIEGGLPHPAFVCSKKKIEGQYFNVTKGVVDVHNSNLEGKEKNKNEEEKKVNTIYGKIEVGKGEPEKLLLLNRLAPGDILVMTNAIRDLHKAYPGRYQTDVRTPCNQIFDNSPYITHLHYNEQEYQKLNAQFSTLDGIKDISKHTGRIDDIKVIDMHYPMIHTSGTAGWHFGYGHRDWLEQILNVKIPQTDIRPDIFLSDNEKNWPNPMTVFTGEDCHYWVINAGSKGDYTLKQYPFYQEVINALENKVKFVQIGLREHNHELLDGCIDMRGKTDNVRDLFRLIAHSDGVLTCVSFHMHIAAALRKPCVVVAGAREGARWEMYPGHQFLYVNGCLPCADWDGCWKSKHGDCNNKKDNIPMCMHLIKPQDVVRGIERYYDGGMIKDDIDSTWHFDFNRAESAVLS